MQIFVVKNIVFEMIFKWDNETKWKNKTCHLLIMNAHLSKYDNFEYYDFDI